jgi:uncharacterized protein (TIGR02001 family)
VRGDQRRRARGNALNQPSVPPRPAISVLLLGLAASAQGQMAASLGIESNDRVRGVSLGDSRPALHLGLAWDPAGGVYAGAAVTAVRFGRPRRQAALTAYLGLARLAAPGLTWEIGTTATRYGTDSQYDLVEAYAGLIGARWAARAYVSPSYYGSGVRTLYLELNGSLPLPGRLRLFGHLGRLARVGGGPQDGAGRVRMDRRVGIGAIFEACDVQLARVAADRGADLPPYGASRGTWVLGATAAF